MSDYKSLLPPRVQKFNRRNRSPSELRRYRYHLRKRITAETNVKQKKWLEQVLHDVESALTIIAYLA